MKFSYDFGGWATKVGVLCSDGRTIMKDAFKECNGQKVPLVWNHEHNSSENVLGHALLENRDDGVYAYCTFNATENGQNAKILVRHGDVNSLSIYANKLQQDDNRNVSHGIIREVSLVLAGANPGACIDSIMYHGEDGGDPTEAIIHNNELIDCLEHGEIDLSDEDEQEESGKEEGKDGNQNDDQIAHAENQEDNKVADTQTQSNSTSTNDEGKTVQDVLDTLNDEQKLVVEALIGEILAAQEDNNGGNEEMKQNVFDNDQSNGEDVMIHDALNAILADAKSQGGLRNSYLAHAAEYGIEGIDLLEPEYKDVNASPRIIDNQPRGWIQTVVSGVHNTPFAKVRMTFADITADEARAKGYIKGKYKKEEVISLLRRQVNPTTIYKKQKFDRDDLVDIDFNVIPWIKNEMNIKLEEEKARAYLFGDGRSSADDDKIREDCIIPIVADEDLFTIKYEVTPEQDETLEHALITAAVKAQDDYQGSGNLTAFIETKQVTRMLLMEDKFGHRLYPTLTDLASGMGVNKIEKVPAGIVPNGVYGVIVDLSDYNVGMKDMGRTNFFDDFDIDYNQNKYLLETRQSAALTVPYSAIVLKEAN